MSPLNRWQSNSVIGCEFSGGWGPQFLSIWAAPQDAWAYPSMEKGFKSKCPREPGMVLSDFIAYSVTSIGVIAPSRIKGRGHRLPHLRGRNIKSH